MSIFLVFLNFKKKILFSVCNKSRNKKNLKAHQSCAALIINKYINI